jgi:hypothetical protein
MGSNHDHTCANTAEIRYSPNSQGPDPTFRISDSEERKKVRCLLDEEIIQVRTWLIQLQDPRT